MRKIFTTIVFGVATLLISLGSGATVLKAGFAETSALDRVSQRMAIENQAKKMAESGNLDQAISLYKKATQPQYINYAYDQNTALGAMREIYKWKGEYGNAMAIIDKSLENTPNAKHFIMEKREIEALAVYGSTTNPQVIYQHIADIRSQYADQLPPTKYLFHSTVYISDIFRLYDTIGDHDAGIAFIDEILAYFRAGKAGDPKPGRVDAEYIKIRDAFELDKKEGTKGRATKALIQSDYFPW